MIKLLTLLVAWRLLRAIATIAVVTALALLLLAGANHGTAHGYPVIEQLQRASGPLEQPLQHTLRKAFGP